MYLTEEEAMGKWCPFGQMENQPICRECIASQCMAWRWKQPGKFEAVQKYREEHGCSVREAKEYVDRENPELTMEKTHGYCGLAGRP
jgi:hypothetical protein